MPYTPELIEEMNILAQYNLHTTQEGLKVHASASAESIKATRRLYDKGLVTQPDGGYLTHLGREVAEHVQATLAILKDQR